MAGETSEDKPGRKLRMIAGRAETDSPSSLGETGRALWTKITLGYDVSDEGGRAILEQACLAADRAASMRVQIDKDGETVRTRGGLKAHPLLAQELSARSLVIRTLVRLGLNSEPLRNGPGRPGSQGLGIGPSW
jgi:hypothetical protein